LVDTDKGQCHVIDFKELRKNEKCLIGSIIKYKDIIELKKEEAEKDNDNANNDNVNYDKKIKEDKNKIKL